MAKLTVDHVQKALAAYESAVHLHSWFVDQRAKMQKRFTLYIPQNDPLYIDAHTWLLQQPADETIRNWSVRSNHRRQLSYTYNGDNFLHVLVDGHRVGIKVAADGKPDDGVSSGGSVPSGYSGFFSKSLIICTDTQAAMDAVKARLAKIADERKNIDNPPRIHIYSKWGWTQSEAPLRSLESVVLNPGLKENIASDVARFLTAESDYVERGLPWHRGYLLYGPPGTGKTSLIKGLAKEHNLDIYFLSLTDMKGDSELIDKIHEVKPRSIVLLEDVDVVSAATRRIEKSEGNISADSGGVTMSGLLNVLDGMFTPHGMIGVLTTNHLDCIDPAVIRPGRIDVQLHLDYCTSNQIHALFFSYYQRAIDIGITDIADLRITSAEITEIFKSNLYDSLTAERDLKIFIDKKIEGVD